MEREYQTALYGLLQERHAGPNVFEALRRVVLISNSNGGFVVTEGDDRDCNSIDTVQQLGNASQLQNGGTARYSNSAALKC
eukprot:CAMPEP_0205876912 /NCGR_PEP_ID=MMETSP1083-20121108/14042_1 /ASSEMBLY_ACC=CAM_ASM_000430 /TAXON_ID=97485 /ORGANISM="Prymnesium parvum, Strain Texoma1" /LENGTH=80 /DNA_ID=CAMNT_0053239687 /DNA_START=882 /DNA_END=1124 /DNA_ORIENTATION=-